MFSRVTFFIVTRILTDLVLLTVGYRPGCVPMRVVNIRIGSLWLCSVLEAMEL
ncbi:unnamed protein product, partial [Nesidiocoris tenuis]